MHSIPCGVPVNKIEGLLIQNLSVVHIVSVGLTHRGAEDKIPWIGGDLPAIYTAYPSLSFKLIWSRMGEVVGGEEQRLKVAFGGQVHENIQLGDPG